MCLGHLGRRSLRGFSRSRSGNVAMMWALMGAILVGMIGLTVDFTRAQAIRAQMQNAADGAALVAERSSNMTLDERKAAARAFFDAEIANIGGEIDLSALHFDVLELDSGGHHVEAWIDMPVTLARLISGNDWRVAVTAEAEAQASPPIEVVLALDNTGSMQNDMSTLREGAENLAEFLLSLDGDSVRVGLVPFVAQVNIGSNAPTSWLDTAGNNPLHGVMMENRYIGYRSTTSNACTNATNYPTSYGGYPIVWVRGHANNPAPYTNTGRCYAFSPAQVNIFSVYDNLPASAAWAGCVEARPIPYDISDAPPTTDATRFVPYFAMDEGGDNTDTNNWLTNTSYDRAAMINIATSTLTYQSGVRSWGVYKYRSGVPVSLNTGATNSARGPNRGCPTPIVPLTDNDNTVITAIQNMQATFGGGTNQIEGLVWAWRVVSPGEPFTQGRAYNDPADPVRKVIVLFTDGDNTSLESTNTAFESEYSALSHRSLYRTIETMRTPGTSGNAASWGYGVASAYRRNISPLNGIVEGGWNATDADGDVMVAYMNARQLQLCTAIRDLGIEIYTIGFRITEGGTADELLEDCATQDGEHYFHADNQSELLQAFTAIGSGIGKLRITQ